MSKVVRRSCNPTFMEMLEYRVSMDILKCRTLQASVWESSQFQVNLKFFYSLIYRLEYKVSIDILKCRPLQLYRSVFGSLVNSGKTIESLSV